MACQVAQGKLESIAHNFTFSRGDTEPLVQTCMTTLSSKMYAPSLSLACRCADGFFEHAQ